MPNTFSALYRAALSISAAFIAKYVYNLDIHLKAEAILGQRVTLLRAMLSSFSKKIGVKTG